MPRVPLVLLFLVGVLVMKLVCVDCSGTFSNSKSLQSHRNDFHCPDDNRQCSDCNKVFSSKTALRKHRCPEAKKEHDPDEEALSDAASFTESDSQQLQQLVSALRTISAEKSSSSVSVESSSSSTSSSTLSAPPHSKTSIPVDESKRTSSESPDNMTLLPKSEALQLLNALVHDNTLFLEYLHQEMPDMSDVTIYNITNNVKRAILDGVDMEKLLLSDVESARRELVRFIETMVKKKLSLKTCANRAGDIRILARWALHEKLTCQSVYNTIHEVVRKGFHETYNYYNDKYMALKIDVAHVQEKYKDMREKLASVKPRVDHFFQAHVDNKAAIYSSSSESAFLDNWVLPFVVLALNLHLPAQRIQVYDEMEIEEVNIQKKRRQEQTAVSVLRFTSAGVFIDVLQDKIKGQRLRLHVDDFLAPYLFFLTRLRRFATHQPQLQKYVFVSSGASTADTTFPSKCYMFLKNVLQPNDPSPMRFHDMRTACVMAFGEEVGGDRQMMDGLAKSMRHQLATQEYYYNSASALQLTSQALQKFQEVFGANPAYQLPRLHKIEWKPFSAPPAALCVEFRNFISKLQLTEADLSTIHMPPMNMDHINTIIQKDKTRIKELTREYMIQLGIDAAAVDRVLHKDPADLVSKSLLQTETIASSSSSSAQTRPILSSSSPSSGQLSLPSSSSLMSTSSATNASTTTEGKRTFDSAFVTPSATPSPVTKVILLSSKTKVAMSRAAVGISKLTEGAKSTLLHKWVTSSFDEKIQLIKTFVAQSNHHCEVTNPESIQAKRAINAFLMPVHEVTWRLHYDIFKCPSCGQQFVEKNFTKSETVLLACPTKFKYSNFSDPNIGNCGKLTGKIYGVSF